MTTPNSVVVPRKKNLKTVWFAKRVKSTKQQKKNNERLCCPRDANQRHQEVNKC